MWNLVGLFIALWLTTTLQGQFYRLYNLWAVLLTCTELKYEQKLGSEKWHVCMFFTLFGFYNGDKIFLSVFACGFGKYLIRTVYMHYSKALLF